MTRDYAKNYRPQPKQRNTRVVPTQRSAPGWVWLLAGLLIGALLTGILRFKDEPSTLPAEVDGTAEVVEEEATAPPPSHKPRFDFYTLLKETEVIVPDENGNLPPKTVVIPEVKEATIPEEAEKSTAKTVEKPTTPAPADATKTVVATATPVTKPAPTTPPTPTPSKPIAPSPTPAPTASAPPTPTASAPPADRTVHILQAGSYKNPADADSVRARLLLLNMHATVERVTASGGETWHRVLIGPYANPNDASNASALLRQNGIDSIQLKRKP